MSMGFESIFDTMKPGEQKIMNDPNNPKAIALKDYLKENLFVEVEYLPNIRGFKLGLRFKGDDKPFTTCTLPT